MAEQLSAFWFLPLLGYVGIDSDKVRDRIDLVIKYVRVSSEEQSDKSGKQRQNESLDDEIEKIDCEKSIKISKDWESASTMLRENIDEIVETVREHPDKTIALMIENVDRLSRAPPFEAAVFLWVLSRLDVIFYFDDLGYYDFSDPHQQLTAFFELYRSRQDYNNIKERTSSGRRQIKENNGLPHRAPFGYDKIDSSDDTDNHQVEINEQQAGIIIEAVERILSVEDPTIKSIWEDLKEEYENKVESFPSYQKLLRTLRNKKITGEIIHKGEVIGQIPQIISTEDYEAVIESIGIPDNSENEELDHSLQSIIDRFGVDGSIHLFDIIKGRCPECGGDVKTRGSAKRWGHRTLKYKCIGSNHDPDDTGKDAWKDSEEVNDAETNDDGTVETEQGCGFSGPLLSGSFLRRWDGGLPIVCPRCQSPADENDWQRSNTKIDAVEQTCDECGLWYSADVGIEYDSPVERGLDVPQHAIRWFDDDDTDTDAEMNSDNASNNESNNSTDTDTDDCQQKFDSFL